MRKSISLLAAIILLSAFFISAPVSARSPFYSYALSDGSFAFGNVKASNVELDKKVQIQGNSKNSGGGKTTLAAKETAGTLCGGTRYAVIVGISDYPGMVNDLNYADDDAIMVAKVLQNFYKYDPLNMQILTSITDTSAANIKSKITDFVNKAVAGDEIFFFYSGHGGAGQADDGDNNKKDQAIISHDGTNLVYIWDGELATLFAPCAKNGVRVISGFDSCKSGGMVTVGGINSVITTACSENALSMESTKYAISDSEYSALGHGQYTYLMFYAAIVQGFANQYGEPGISMECEFR